MSVVVTDNRTQRDEADSTTGWTGGTISLVTSDPDPVEATGHLGNVVSSATVDCYHTAAAADLTGKLVYAWALPLGAMDTLVNGGVAVHIGDGTNRIGFHFAGSDVAVFRHNSGQPTYQCLLLDQASLPANHTVRAGSLAALAWSAITQVGVMFKTLAKSKGGTANCFVDAVRIWDPSLNNGAALTISGGTSGDPGTFTQIASDDALTSTGKAYGVVRLLGAGAIGLQGALRFGDQASGSSWFEDKNVTVVFEDRGLAASRYKIFISDNGVGTTTFKLGTKVGTGVSAAGSDGVTITGGPNVNWQFDAATDTDVTDVFIYGSTFNRATQGVSFRAGHEFIGGVIASSGAIVLNGATFVNNSVVTPTVAADASAIVWGVNTDPDTNLHGTSVSKGTNAHHAIEFGTTSPTEMTVRAMNFTGFNAANGQNDSTFHVKRTSGTVTINCVDCTGNLTYKTDGATVNIVTAVVTVKVTVKDSADASDLQNARVLLRATTGTSVSITRSGSTATVTHTAHGYETGQKVNIRGANEGEYNVVASITVTDANTYTYAVTGTPATPATGTITSHRVFLDGLTDASGLISTSLPYPGDVTVVGNARRYTVTPSYKPGLVTGTITSAGFDQTAFLVKD